ncbi:MAG TPA: hypothetical protein VKS22_12880 [Candidatus Binataceae bacterium]|nr:hypothetical protein [Candidatus Binataceae bacterium]
MKHIKRIIPLAFVGFFLVLLVRLSGWTDSLVEVTSESAQSANDSVSWSQLGGDGAVLSASTFNANSAGGSVTGTLSGPNSLVAVVCPASPSCSWADSFAGGDTLVWTSDAGNSGTGPLTLSFANPISGAGALIQSDVPGQFTVEITAFGSGGGTLGSFSETSDTNGDATYLGLMDSSGANIASIEYQITACGQADCSDFAIDTLFLNDTPVSASPTPTPTATPTPVVTTTLTTSPAKLDFKNVDATATSKTKKLTLHNKGANAATIGQIAPPSSFTLSSDNCSNLTVAPKKKCTVDFAFAPATAVGSVSETLVIPYNGASPSETLEGNGIAVTLSAPKSVTAPSVAAGSVGKAKKITIHNKSTATVQIGAASLSANFQIASGGDACANTALAAKGKCVVSLEFAPATGTSGTLPGTLAYNFTYGANSNSVSISLKGKVK